MTTKAGLVWREIHWPRPLGPDRVIAVLRQWAADQRSPKVVLEVRTTPDGVCYAIGAHVGVLPQLVASLGQLVPGTVLVDPTSSRDPVLAAGRLSVSPGTVRCGLRTR